MITTPRDPTRPRNSSNATWRLPTQILDARLMKPNVQYDF
jgi:hypothetical protein